MDFNCKYCNIQFKRNCDLTRHKKSQKCKENINKYNNEINLKENLKKNENENVCLTTKIIELEKEILELKKQLNDKDIIIKNQEKLYYLHQDKELTKNNIKTKDNTNYENSFQIDINVNNKQLNKTKFKDVPEEQIKNDIQSLKLKDNYQLEYRETDGYINVTNLCKAGGKHFKNWNQNDKTKRFLDVLSSTAGIPTFELLKQEQGGNGERHTWTHPQVAINIAQWISPEFDVIVSKWVYEIMLTGKVDIRENKTTQELDQMNKENKLLKNRVKLLESKVLQKQHRETFENGKNVIYIVTTEYKEAQGHYKIGKTKDLKERMSVYNTSDKHEVIFYTNCKNKKSMDLLEQLIHMKLEDKRIEPNKEWFLSEEDAEDFIKIIEECKKINNL
jgi:hypothetical protein